MNDQTDNPTDRQPPAVNWQELAESLGINTATEIEFYFRGNVQLPGFDPVDDGIAPTLSPEATEIYRAAQAASPGIADSQSQTHTPSGMNTEPDSHPHSGEPTDHQATPSEAGEPSPIDEIHLDWGSPAEPVTSSEHHDPPTEPVSSPAIQSNRTPSGEPGEAPAGQPLQPANWDDLADSLGIERTEELIDFETRGETGTVDQSQTEAPRPARTPRSPSRDRAEGSISLTGFGDGLLEGQVPDAGAPDEIFADSDDSAETRSGSSMDDRAEDSNLAVREEPDEDFDSFAESARDGDSDDAFGDYVEFEVEDLDPGVRRGRKPSRKRPDGQPRRGDREETDRRDTRPAADASGGRRDERGQEPDEEPDEERSGRRSRGRRNRGRGRGRGRQPKPETGQVSVEEETGDVESHRDAEAHNGEENDGDRRPRSKGRGRGGRSERRSDGRERSEGRRGGRGEGRNSGEGRGGDEDRDSGHDQAPAADVDDSDDSRSGVRKPRNLPTWNETVDVIVQANIASRKKQPRRRRGGGGSGGGGGGGRGRRRDRDRRDQDR